MINLLLSCDYTVVFIAHAQEKDGKISISAACRMCRMCVRKGPKGAIEYVEGQKKAQIDKTKWRGITVYVDHVDGVIHPVTYELLGKAKELAAIANLKSQISTCEEVMKKNYLEIGKIYFEQYSDMPEPPFEKQCETIKNSQRAIADLQEKIEQLKTK